LEGCNSANTTYKGFSSSLLNHDGKAFERVILNILTPLCEGAGFFYNFAIRFRANQCAADATFISKMCASYSKEENKALFKCFVDYVKVYDKISRAVLWMVLSRKGDPEK
jgi:hypothetical protein